MGALRVKKLKDGLHTWPSEIVGIVLLLFFLMGAPCFKKLKGTIYTLTEFRSWCECRGGRPGLSVLMSLTVCMDVKQH